MNGLMALLVLSLLLSACQARPALVKPPLEEEGEVYVYVEPLPQEAERLRFTLDRFSLVKADGGEFPVPLALSEFSRKEMTRQRLLASGRVPPGAYSGISVRARDAYLRTEEGEAVLLVPDNGTQLAFPFRVVRKRALVLSLTFRHEESVEGGYRLDPAFSMAVPGKPLAGLSGYVTIPEAANILVFDKVAGRVTGVIAAGAPPRGMATDARARRGYALLPSEHAVAVIDLDLGEVVDRIVLSASDNPQECALTPDGGLLLTVNQGSDSVSVIDPLSLVELARIGVGQGPASVLVNPAGRTAYVFSTLSNTISVIDIVSRSLVRTVGTDTGPLRGALNARRDRLYVHYLQSPYIDVFDPVTLSLTRRTFVGMGVSSIKVDTRTDYLYVSKTGSPLVEIYDPFSLVAGDFLRIGDEAAHMAIDGERNNLYLLLPNRKTVMAVNLLGRHFVSEMDVGDSPFWLSLMGER